MMAMQMLSSALTQPQSIECKQGLVSLLVRPLPWMVGGGVRTPFINCNGWSSSQKGAWEEVTPDLHYIAL